MSGMSSSAANDMAAARRRPIAGATVRYFQPDAAGILASWSGRKAGGGEIRETTVTGVRESGGVRYYDTAEGVLLTDADLR